MWIYLVPRILLSCLCLIATKAKALLPVAIEPLLTPLFLRDMSPLILSSLTRTLLDTNIPIPPQVVSLPLSKPIQVNVTMLRVVELKWTQGSGLAFEKGGVLGFTGSLDSVLRASYLTDSRYLRTLILSIVISHEGRLRLPSGNLTARVQGCHVRAGIKLDYDPTQLILVPRFEYLDIRFDSLSVCVPRLVIYCRESNTHVLETGQN
jgi:hypothetical protein